MSEINAEEGQSVIEVNDEEKQLIRSFLVLNISENTTLEQIEEDHNELIKKRDLYDNINDPDIRKEWHKKDAAYKRIKQIKNSRNLQAFEFIGEVSAQQKSQTHPNGKNKLI